ncbi:MAG: trehalose-6-phosphate synthase [Candidatus Krumholzibacteria bacterium]|nr:trehalose-6-phosphate synthase [Candidatus Krumholzibacteria bacterium]
MNDEIRRLVIASNRLPFVLERLGDSWRSTPGSGGLVTALAPVLRDRGGLWVGWPGIVGDVDLSPPMAYLSRNAGFTMQPVSMSQEELEMYYRGLSNEVLWPLFHDLQSYCNFEPAYWKAYLSINRRFASVIRDSTLPGDFVWVHDYHLICVASELRAMGVSSSLGFFLHIPFPPLDIFVKLPWRTEILRALLDFDLIGFQTARDRRNFMHCLRTFVRDLTVEGKGQVVTVSVPGRTVRVGYFPISIDYDEFSLGARSEEVSETAWYIHEKIPEGKIVLGVDRLDYTKGIRYRLRAFDHLLREHPDLRGRITLVQIVVPSRRDIPMYRDLKIEIERLVGEINGRFTVSGWVPIHYLHRSLDRRELLAYYRTAEIALITPLKDGMNLVAKEYCAANTELTGALILSEFAGAAPQLQRGALLVNPYDIEEVAGALFRAWSMDAEERRERMNRMQQTIQRYDIYWWVDSFLRAAIAGTLDAFPVIEEYQSSINLLSPVEFD